VSENEKAPLKKQETGRFLFDYFYFYFTLCGFRTIEMPKRFIFLGSVDFF